MHKGDEMKLIKKNLKTVKNKLLCELEDYIFDSVMPLMSNTKMSAKQQEQLTIGMMKNIMNAIKDNSVRFATICYTDIDGKELQEADLVDVPLKIKIMQECLPEIMEIMSDYLQDGEESQESGKPKAKPIRKRS